MLIIHCSRTSNSLLVATWLVLVPISLPASLTGRESQQLFPFVLRKYLVREDREKVGSQWALQSSVRLSTLLLLKSILATERSRISRSLLVPVTSHHHILLLSLWEDSTWASDWVSRCYNFDCKTRTLQRERQRMISSVSPWKSQAQCTHSRQSRNDARKFPPDLPYIFVRIYLDLISDYNPYFQSKHGEKHI